MESIRITNQGLPVIVVSGDKNPTYVARAAVLGAYDDVLRNGHSIDICSSLRGAVEGQSPPDGSRLTALRRKLSEVVDLDRLPEKLPLSSRESQYGSTLRWGRWINR